MDRYHSNCTAYGHLHHWTTAASKPKPLPLCKSKQYILYLPTCPPVYIHLFYITGRISKHLPLVVITGLMLLFIAGKR